MANYFTGKGYGISNITDLNGRPLLTYQGPKDKRPFLLSDRVAQEFDFTAAQQLKAGSMKNDRLDGSTASYIKQKLGGGKDDELDHKISLELGGSNTPSNLFIQHGINNGASAASDQLENSLALEVAAGRMSLLTAWRTLSEQKGFLLGEDTQTGTTFSISQAASVLYDVAKNHLSGHRATDIKKADEVLKAQLNDDIEKLKQNPQNQVLITKIFQEQVASVSNQLNVSQKDAGGVVKSYLANYAKSKGVEPKELMSALNINVQRIIDNSKGSPDVFGVKSTTLLKITTLLEATGGVLLGIGVILAVIGAIMIGPEALAGAFAGGLLTAGFAALGVSIPLGLGFLSFEVGGAMTLLGIALNMVVKEIYDNSYLLPTQNISALKDALAVQKGLAAFLPSEQNAAPTTPTRSYVGGSTRIVGNPTGLFIGHIDQGHLQAVTPFAPQEFESIGSPDTLAIAAQHNIAAYLSTLAGVLDYSITAKAHVTLADGTELVGNTVYIETSVSKKGVPHYKKIQDKFAVADVYIKTSTKGRIHIEELILGPIDETKYQPTTSEFAQLANSFDGKLITTDTGAIKAITLQAITSTDSSPTSTTGENTTTPTTDQSSSLYLGNTIFKYATRDSQGKIIDLDPKNFPTQYQFPGSNFADGRLRFTEDADNQLLAILEKTVGLDHYIAGGVLAILDRGDNQQEYQYRSDARWMPFGNLEDITRNFGGFHGLAVYLINGGKVVQKNDTTRSVDGSTTTQRTLLIPDTSQNAAPEIKPYVIFQGSPDVFDRKTGRHISSGEAMTLGIFTKGLIEHLNSVRYEVQNATDFAIYAGKDLTNFPV